LYLEVEAEERELVEKQGFETRHAYSWPDGSIFFYARGEKGIPVGQNIKVQTVEENENPFKVGHATLREYFERPTT